MSNYLQVEIEEVELVHKELGKTSRWRVLAPLVLEPLDDQSD